jgi:hypothetical protein
MLKHASRRTGRRFSVLLKSMPHKLDIRPATVGDARTIAEFYQLCSGGVADYIWSQLAEPGGDLLDVGTRRYAREGVPFSYQISCWSTPARCCCWQRRCDPSVERCWNSAPIRFVASMIDSSTGVRVRVSAGR